MWPARRRGPWPTSPAAGDGLLTLFATSMDRRDLEKPARAAYPLEAVANEAVVFNGGMHEPRTSDSTYVC